VLVGEPPDGGAGGQEFGRVRVGPDKWEVGYELAPEFWGRGLATEGAREAIRFGWARTPLPRIISATAAGHLASRRVMEKCGLVFQGEITFRTARVAWYAIDRPAAQPMGAPPGPRLAHQPLACRKPALGSRSVLPV
jgi:RimJ/RimL family protein N-acetyltransferase